jgi:hypothetical protein
MMIIDYSTKHNFERSQLTILFTVFVTFWSSSSDSENEDDNVLANHMLWWPSLKG